MGSFECSTVIAAIPAHDDLSAQQLETLYQLNFLLWQHPGKYLAPVDNPLEQLRVLVPDHAEGVAIAGKHIVLAGHILNLAGGCQDAGCLRLWQAVGHSQLTSCRTLLSLNPL